MPIQGKFYTSRELQKLLGNVTPAAISRLRAEHGWTSPHRGLYDSEPVERYLYARWRKELAQQFGVQCQLIYHDEWDRDDNCPVCGAFAIWMPAQVADIQNVGQPIYADGWPWRCIEGHRG